MRYQEAQPVKPRQFFFGGVITIETKNKEYQASADLWADMNAKNKGMRDKRVSLVEAVNLIKDGMNVGVGGVQYSRVPIAVIRELIRAGRKNITVFRALMSFEADFLFVSGVMRKAVTSWLSGAVTYGVSPIIRKYIEKGKGEFEEWSDLAMGLRFLAGSMGIPCIPARVDLGSDLEKLNKLATFNCPYTGEKLALFPALNPDLAIIHAQRADMYGNVQIEGMAVVDCELAKAAKRVIVTVERIVSTEEIRRTVEFTKIPFFCVDAVVEIPFGAFPFDCYGCYAPFNEHFREYYKGFEGVKDPEENTRKYIQKYYLEPPTFEDYLDLFGARAIVKNNIRGRM